MSNDRSYLESLKGTNGMSRTVGTAAQVASPGYYPSAYSIRFDSATGEYRVALDQLAFRQ